MPSSRRSMRTLFLIAEKQVRRELIETIRMRVYAVSGVRLEEEIRYIGEF